MWDESEFEKQRIACFRKEPLTPKVAAKKIRQAWMHSGSKLFAYVCEFCGNWHLTGIREWKGVRNFTAATDPGKNLTRA